MAWYAPLALRLQRPYDMVGHDTGDMTPQERARAHALQNDCVLQVDIGEDDLDDDQVSVSASMTASMTTSMQRSIHSDNDWYALDTPKIRGSVSPPSLL
jgi:hypothetical protein